MTLQVPVVHHENPARACDSKAHRHLSGRHYRPSRINYRDHDVADILAIHGEFRTIHGHDQARGRTGRPQLTLTHHGCTIQARRPATHPARN